MLLEEQDKRIEGPVGAVLYEVHAGLVLLLEQDGIDHQRADHLAMQLLPRLYDRMASAGLVVRQLEPRHMR